MERNKFSQTNLIKELSYAPDDYRNYLRMNEQMYLKLLNLVTPIIAKKETHLRPTITPHERLSATLRFLATGRKYKDLKFSVIISPQALSDIIPEVCAAIIHVLKPYLQFPKSELEWTGIATEFEERWNFPNCLGAIDGKHVRIIPPPGSGSYYYNYKETHSVVLMAIANANYEFIMVDCGTNGRVSDGGAIEKTAFFEKFTNNKLNIPKPRTPDNTTIELPYVFVGDEAFALHVNLMKPYSQRQLTVERRIYNYRVSRSRRKIENTFGILANRFQVLQTPINLRVDRINLVVMACCCLHNFLRKESAPSSYITNQCVDREDVDGTITPGTRTDPGRLHPLNICKLNSSDAAKTTRDKFKVYFNTDGKVPWQTKIIGV